MLKLKKSAPTNIWLLFAAGQTAISQAKEVIAKLVGTLKSSTVGGAQAVAQAVSDLAAIIARNPNKGGAEVEIRVLLENNRGLLNYALNLFGLSDVWSSIQSMGAGVASQFLNDLIAIILKGKKVIHSQWPTVTVKRIRTKCRFR